jgi:hypothetical protein
VRRVGPFGGLCPDRAITSGRVDLPSLAGAWVLGMLPLDRCGRRLLVDSVVKERGGECRKGCGVRPEAETQFARRLIIGFDGAETNYGWRDWSGGMR